MSTDATVRRTPAATGAAPGPRDGVMREWFWPVATMATIVYASSHSQVASPDLIGIDKVAHFFVYGLLATLLYRTRWFSGRGRVGAIAAALAALVFGVTDEAHQHLTPGRSVEWADLAVDGAGAALGVAVYTAWPAYRRFLEFPSARQVDSPG